MQICEVMNSATINFWSLKAEYIIYNLNTKTQLVEFAN